MTDRSRAAITMAIALLLGAFTYGHAFNISPPGILNDIWYGSVFGWVVFGLALLGVFVVYRWWALLAALAPALVMIVLNQTDYVSPWHDDLSGEPWYVIVGTFALIAFLSFGFLLRAGWEWFWSGRGDESNALSGSA